MKIFIAGATGAVGRQLIPILVKKGHEVTGMTRTEAKQDFLLDLGAEPVIADALDPEAVGQAVSEASPDVIVHQLTALSGEMDMRRPDRFFAVTNRLRTEGTDHLLAAGRAAGVRYVVAQSYAGWPFARTGGTVKSESDPLDPDPPEKMRSTLDAIRYIEEAITGIEWGNGLVLRYGAFYGPGTGTGLEPEASMTKPIREHRFPLIGDAGGVWSFIHIEDAASATVSAIEQKARGIYQIVDDDPAPVSEWLPHLAEALGAKKPMWIPRWLGRVMAGEAAVVLMTDSRGASNEKAKRELDWEPRYASWRQGFLEGLE